MDVKNLSDFTAYAEEKLQKHNLFQTERFFLDVYCLKPGQAQKPHRHPGADKVYIVLEGRCLFQVGSALQEHGVGSAIHAPAGSEHGVENRGQDNARLLVLMTPPPNESKR